MKTKDEMPPYGLEDSKASDYKPKIGNKQVEIAPPTLPGDLAAQLKLDIEVPAILTEVTSDCEQDPSNPSTQRSPEKVNEDYEFGKLLGEGAYAVVREAIKKTTG